MRSQTTIIALATAASLLLHGCAGLKKSGEKHYFRFANERTFRSKAIVLSKREVYATIEFQSEPGGASVYAYDHDRDKKSNYLGKTPFSYNVMVYHITDYADMTAEYEVTIDIVSTETGTIDYSDPDNKHGEITFSFLFKKKGYKPKIERVAVAATNETLVKALSGQPLPSYQFDVTLERE